MGNYWKIPYNPYWLGCIVGLCINIHVCNNILPVFHKLTKSQHPRERKLTSCVDN